MWHEGLIYKIQSIGILGPPLKIIESFLNNRFQRVLLNGQSAYWVPVLEGVSQRSIVGPLLFLIYINDLNFNHHIKVKIPKVNKGIGVIKKVYNFLPRSSLVSIYKSFVRPHLDYRDVIYDQPSNETFCDKLETAQYNVALAITGGTLLFGEH